MRGIFGNKNKHESELFFYLRWKFIPQLIGLEINYIFLNLNNSNIAKLVQFHITMYGNQTPIDIHCSKLVDWLVQRRHCKKDWGENLAAIRRKIRSALKDMPEHEEMKQLLIGSKLDYFKSRRIIEILKTTEADSKNFFGYYSSQRMKDWQEIVYSYERDCIYLAEIATDLIRETNYEVPGIRKVISKLNKEKEDAEKERANLLRKAQQFNSEYQRMAQSFDIEGSDVVRELEEKSKLLRNVMNELVSLCGSLKQTTQYYLEYTSSTSKQEIGKLLPMLQYVLEKGNTTVYEWKYGEAPERVEVVEKAASTNPSEIELIDDEIDFGEDLPSSESSSGFVHVDGGNNGNVEESFIKVENINPQISSDNSDKVARGDEAKLILEFRNTRNQFLNNLYELEAFFSQLLHDSMSGENKSNSSFEGGSSIRVYDKSEIEQALTATKRPIDVLSKDKNKILFQMSDSPSYLDNLKEKFASKKKQATDCNLRADSMNDVIKDIERQTRETEIHLKKSISSAKELQSKVESSLTDLYKGRPINIMGCVN